MANRTYFSWYVNKVVDSPSPRGLHQAPVSENCSPLLTLPIRRCRSFLTLCVWQSRNSNRRSDSLCNLYVLCVSVVVYSNNFLTTEAQRLEITTLLIIFVLGHASSLQPPRVRASGKVTART